MLADTIHHIHTVVRLLIQRILNHRNCNCILASSSGKHKTVVWHLSVHLSICPIITGQAFKMRHQWEVPHWDVNSTGAVHASFDSWRQVIPGGCRIGMECPTTTRSERTFSSCFLPRTEDLSVPVIVPWCSLTINCALSTHPSLNAVMSPCTGCYKPYLLILYGGLAAAVR